MTIHKSESPQEEKICKDCLSFMVCRVFGGFNAQMEDIKKQFGKTPIDPQMLATLCVLFHKDVLVEFKDGDRTEVLPDQI